MNKGKLIVIEGIDGSGKSTQYKLLLESLEASGIAYKNIVFPRYSEESSALIRMYLGGEFGTHPDDVNAYTASTFFSVDRFAAYSCDWGKYYNAGELIISDRYTTSNAIHQGSKLPPEEITGYFEWLADLEYRKMAMPEPDLVFYLDIDLETSMRRMARRQSDTNTHADIHEKDTEYLSKCLSAADTACSYYNWFRVPFVKEGRELSAEEKNKIILNKLLSVIR